MHMLKRTRTCSLVYPAQLADIVCLVDTSKVFVLLCFSLHSRMLGLHSKDDNLDCSVISEDGLFNESLAVRQSNVTFAPSYFGALWLPTAAIRPGDTLRGYAVFRTRPSPYSTRLVLESS